MSIGTGHEKLKRVNRELLAEWDLVSRTWRDEVSRRFEKEHLEMILTRLREAGEAMGHMDGMIQRARRDCE